MKGMKFEYKTIVTIGDTNVLGNMYFSNHFKIQGIVRELWMNQCVSNSMEHLSEGLILITKTAHCDYIKDFYLCDNILCYMSIGKIGRANFELNFEFVNESTSEMHALGYQKIVFADSQHKICKIPNDFLTAAKEYQSVS